MNHIDELTYFKAWLAYLKACAEWQLRLWSAPSGNAAYDILLNHMEHAVQRSQQQQDRSVYTAELIAVRWLLCRVHYRGAESLPDKLSRATEGHSYDEPSEHWQLVRRFLRARQDTVFAQAHFHIARFRHNILPQMINQLNEDGLTALKEAHSSPTPLFAYERRANDIYYTLWQMGALLIVRPANVLHVSALGHLLLAEHNRL